MEAGSPVGNAETTWRPASRITAVQLHHDGAGNGDGVATGDPFRIRISYESDELVLEPAFGISILSVDGMTLIGTNTKIDGYAIPELSGSGSVEFVVPRLDLTPGSYLVTVAMHDRFMGILDRKSASYRFRVVSGPATAGVFLPSHQWRHIAGDEPAPASIADTEIAAVSAADEALGTP
jgi:hypothetical protein